MGVIKDFLTFRKGKKIEDKYGPQSWKMFAFTERNPRGNKITTTLLEGDRGRTIFRPFTGGRTIRRNK